jgi:DNA invertase Pin-like site-specific DNA recombinase
MTATPIYTELNARQSVRESKSKKGVPMAVIGYARVSTIDQMLDLQQDALKEAGATVMYEDKASGKTTDRPELEHCLKSLREGDTLVVWRLDRLGRSVKDLVRIVDDLNERGIAFRSLKEFIDTGGPTGKFVFHLFAALAEFERGLVRERTMAGLAAARARGRKGGRPRRLTEKETRAALAMMKSREIAVAEIARRFSVSRSTLYSLQSASGDVHSVQFAKE